MKFSPSSHIVLDDTHGNRGRVGRPFHRPSITGEVKASKANYDGAITYVEGFVAGILSGAIADLTVDTYDEVCDMPILLNLKDIDDKEEAVE